MARATLELRLDKGDVIGKAWTIIRKLGEGGMGEVYQAYDTKTDRFLLDAKPEFGDIKLLPGEMYAQAFEDEKIQGAIKTDFILSAEIMAIALAEVEANSIGMQALSKLAITL